MPRAAKRDAHVELCAQSPFPPTMDGCSRDNPALIGAGPLLRFGRLATIGYIVLALTLVVFSAPSCGSGGSAMRFLRSARRFCSLRLASGSFFQRCLYLQPRGEFRRPPFTHF